VRTDMIAATDAYRGSRAKTPDQAAALVVRALEDRPLRINTVAGNLAQVIDLVAPRLMDALAAAGARRYPDSPAARGEQ